VKKTSVLGTFTIVIKLSNWQIGNTSILAIHIVQLAGFPLRLNAEGSATIGMSAKGKIDIRQMFGSPSTFDINGSVKPSAALEVRASMGVDGQVASTGLKIVNTLHSSTVLDGVVQLRDGRIFNLDWNLPQDKIEIFNAE